ncbi:MAG: transglycosylase domain-containing protein [Marinilabiliales bacterium]|nr:transglycosylase domain-containing protein [Marinilabiliales bacterium]
MAKRHRYLSWAEAATLAVLPNAPSLIYPGKNKEQLKRKRDILLRKLKDKGVISEMDYELALDEPLPDKPFPLPNYSNHLINRSITDGLNGKFIYSTVDLNLQLQVNQIVERFSREFQNNEIFNAAAIVIEVETGNIVAYKGNSYHPENLHENQVDIISSPEVVVVY